MNVCMNMRASGSLCTALDTKQIHHHCHPKSRANKTNKSPYTVQLFVSASPNDNEDTHRKTNAFMPHTPWAQHMRELLMRLASLAFYNMREHFSPTARI